jgi:predicted ribosome quality control (RQC) complex YloA/Tae2 family protein
VDIEALFRFRDRLLASAAPFCLGAHGRMGSVSPIPAPGQDAPGFTHRYGPFGSIGEACERVGDVIVRTAYETILDRFRAPLRRHFENRKRLQAKLESDLGAAEAFDVGRNEADILAAFQSKIPPGITEIELPDLYAPGKKRRIELDPALPIADQIQKRYRRATKLERSREILKDRIQTVKGEILGLAEKMGLAERASGFKEAFDLLQQLMREHRLLRQSRRRVQADVTLKQYRRYDLDERWFALVGRNDHENDEITFRISAPDDFWLHAQQVPGSHVVLRTSGATGQPPKSILESAAAIAAFYSRARHSGLVPVIYTRRKYVRKFRGAKPGEVKCEREKTIFVQPTLPTEHE